MRTPAKPTTCRQCGAPTLTGPDADRAALTVHIDPTPITREAELTCIILERHLYELDTDQRIYRRPPRRALTHTPLSLTIHATHVCDQPLPTDHTPTRSPQPDTPPF